MAIDVKMTSEPKSALGFPAFGGFFSAQYGSFILGSCLMNVYVCIYIYILFMWTLCKLIMYFVESNITSNFDSVYLDIFLIVQNVAINVSIQIIYVQLFINLIKREMTGDREFFYKT
jgi:hypothetical protein